MSKYTAISLFITFSCVVGFFALGPFMGTIDAISLILVVGFIIVLLLSYIIGYLIKKPVLISDIADYFVVTEEFAHYRLELMFQHRVDGFISLRDRLGSIELLN